MSETRFDELAPLHPQVGSGRPTIRARTTRAVVARAARPGYRTTEFWLVAMAIVAPVGLALAGVDRRQLREIAVGGGLVAAGYALGRSYVKGSLARAAVMEERW